MAKVLLLIVSENIPNKKTKSNKAYELFCVKLFFLIIKFTTSSIKIHKKKNPVFCEKEVHVNIAKSCEKRSARIYTNNKINMLKRVIGFVLVKKFAIITIFYTFACKYN